MMSLLRFGITFETSIDLYILFLFQEDILFSVVGDVKPEEMPDFIVTEDVTGVNAGIFTSAFSLHLCLFLCSCCVC